MFPEADIPSICLQKNMFPESTVPGALCSRGSMFPEQGLRFTVRRAFTVYG